MTPATRTLAAVVAAWEEVGVVVRQAGVLPGGRLKVVCELGPMVNLWLEVAPPDGWWLRESGRRVALYREVGR